MYSSQLLSYLGPAIDLWSCFLNWLTWLQDDIIDTYMLIVYLYNLVGWWSMCFKIYPSLWFDTWTLNTWRPVHPAWCRPSRSLSVRGWTLHRGAPVGRSRCRGVATSLQSLMLRTLTGPHMQGLPKWRDQNEFFRVNAMIGKNRDTLGDLQAGHQ